MDFVVDCKDAPMMNASTIGLLVRAYKGLKPKGGHIYLCNVSNDILEIVRKTSTFTLFMEVHKGDYSEVHG